MVRSGPGAPFRVARRLSRLASAATVALLVVAPAAQAAPAFGLADVAAKAERLAQQPFQDTKGSVPDWLLKISYDQWRDIRYRPDRALWSDRRTPFRAQFFHPGLYYDRVVAMNVVDEAGVRPFAFSTNLFDYGKNDFASKVPADLGYAGFRIHYPIKTPKRLDEVIVFLGASYFRAVGARQAYGLSARALAIDTVATTGEEFPYFREFWLVTPAPGARQLVLYALLDGPSLTGAYRFVVEPGEQTVVSVESRLFVRKPIEKLGIAPLTSMFYFGENTLRTFPDFRPEVHDSDGLLATFASGEWLWRPLDNPKAIAVNTFQTVDPKGFGLIQRDRDFGHYEDLETRAELRPSAWIAPRSGFGEGAIELVELPTATDINDNVVAYWVPRAPPKAGDRLAFDYVLSWYGDDPKRPPGGRVVATRRDYGKDANVSRFVIDFAGGKLESIPASEPVRGVVSVLNGDDAAAILDQHVVKNDVTGGWRLSFELQPKTAEALELRGFLRKGDDALTETWSYAIVP